MFSSDYSSISAFIFCLSFIVCMLKCLFDWLIYLAQPLILSWPSLCSQCALQVRLSELSALRPSLLWLPLSFCLLLSLDHPSLSNSPELITVQMLINSKESVWMMVGSSRGNMESAKQVLQSSLSLSPYHIRHANNAVSSSFSNFKLIQTIGNKGLGKKGGGRKARRDEGFYERRDGESMVGVRKEEKQAAGERGEVEKSRDNAATLLKE